MTNYKHPQQQESWQRSLNINERFNYLDAEARNHILAEIKFQRKDAMKRMAEKLRIKDAGLGGDYQRGYNQAVQELNTKIDDIINQSEEGK